MRATRLVLIHSPLTGSSTWAATARSLAALGYDVSTPTLSLGAAGPPWYFALATQAAGQVAPGGELILVLHSGAGALAPAMTERLAPRVEACVFVDALLPHPGQSWFDTASPVLAERLRAAARDGRAPVWSDWFDSGALARLLPDEAMRAAFFAELTPPPIAWLEAVAPPAPADWSHTPCGYLQLSDGYQVEADAAARNRWTVRREHRHHLAMMTDPDEVARTLADMIGALA